MDYALLPPDRNISSPHTAAFAGDRAGIEKYHFLASDATEVVRRGGLSYFHAGRGGIVSAGICQIGIHKEHVRLAFIHGAFLPDPRKLLRDTQKYKRFVEIDSYDNAPWDDLKELVMCASQFDPRSIKE